ncbi:hypothetical protein MEO39_27375, partial [Dolichospermum sp. ST_sed2]|nr:hypothetical protein [Dolichospermum sp. ST_sed2]
DSTSASIINDLKFGCKYKWLVKTFDANNKLIDSSKYIHFKISYCKQADTVYNKYKNNYSAVTNNQLFTLDHSHCIINRKGEVVWFLPQTQRDFYTEKQIRCL